jgi:lipoate-protein ligase A
VETVLGYRISWESAAQAFVTAFVRELALKLESAALTPREIQRSDELLREKYDNRTWTEKS